MNQSTFRSESRDRHVNMGIRILDRQRGQEERVAENKIEEVSKRGAQVYNNKDSRRDCQNAKNI